MDKSELEFNYVYGTIFSMDTSGEYAESVETILKEKGFKYERNLANQAAKCCKKLGDALRRLITKGMNAEQKAIALAAVEHQKEIIYEFFLLDGKSQERVLGLILKLKKDAAKMKLVEREEAA